MILSRAASSGPEPAFLIPGAGGWQKMTWHDAVAHAQELAAGLIDLGLNPEDRVALICSTRIEWILADYAVMLAGGATTAIYPSTNPDDVAHILEDSGSSVLIAEDEVQLERLQASLQDLPDLKRVILIDDTPRGSGSLRWSDLRARGREVLMHQPDLVEKTSAEIGPDRLATLIYTSGTTGKPKGVELTHGNWVYEGAAMAELDIITHADVQYLWLPLSHSMGKVLIAIHLAVGGVTAVDGRLDRVLENLQSIKPTYMAAAPRILEKVHSAVEQKATQKGGLAFRLFTWAFGVGREAHQRRSDGKPLGLLLELQLQIADRLVFTKIRDTLGGHLRYMVSGSAPLSSAVVDWFSIAGLTVIEAYGLTETAAGTVVGRTDSLQAGTVGYPLPGTQVALADDGEILIKGPGVMRGYRHRPEATKEVFGVREGWFATGDIGEFDNEGRLRITDRKKDLVKTSGGKYIAPSAIAARFKGLCPLAAEFIVVADGRKYATALVALNEDAVAAFASDNDLATTGFAEISQNPILCEEVTQAIETLNAQLNRWETIKQFRILPRPLTVEDGDLTPSLKVKRKAVAEEFAPLVEQMYS